MDLLKIAAKVASPKAPGEFDWSRVRRWSEGRDPSEYGWLIDGMPVSGSDLAGGTANLPPDLVAAATFAGYSEAEVDVFLMQNADQIAVVDTPTRSPW